jgi:hypothetical protein
LVVQIGAVTFALMEGLGLPLAATTTGHLSADQLPMIAFATLWILVVTVVMVKLGRSLSTLRMRSPNLLFCFAAPMLLVIPLGTFFSAYLFWLGFGATTRELFSVEHERARSLTPELEPKKLRRIATWLFFGLLLNLFALVGLIGWLAESAAAAR